MVSASSTLPAHPLPPLSSLNPTRGRILPATQASVPEGFLEKGGIVRPALSAPQPLGLAPSFQSLLLLLPCPLCEALASPLQALAIVTAHRPAPALSIFSRMPAAGKGTASSPSTPAPNLGN